MKRRTVRLIFLVGPGLAVAATGVGAGDIIADTVRLFRGRPAPADYGRCGSYRLFLFYLAGPPLVLLFTTRPIWLVIAYAALGALFMPFLAGTLAYLLNRREWMGSLRNERAANAALALTLVLFLYLAAAALAGQVWP